MGQSEQSVKLLVLQPGKNTYITFSLLVCSIYLVACQLRGNVVPESIAHNYMTCGFGPLGSYIGNGSSDCFSRLS